MLQLTHIEAVRNFFSLYNAQTQQLDKDAAEVGEELDQTRGELDMLGEQLRQLNRCQDEFVSKYVLVSVCSLLSVPVTYWLLPPEYKEVHEKWPKQ